MSTIKDPVSFNVLDMSTEHISESDRLRLGKLMEGLDKWYDQPIICDYGKGAFVYAATDEQSHYRNYSDEFNAIMEYARHNGYKYVCFDCDATVYPDLPRFD